MYKTKMIKVYLPSFQLCIFSLIINLLVSGIQPLRTIAQDSSSLTDTQQAANNAPTTIEPEILSEINRVRTDPQGYARWLESQRQYYDGIWLKLPGEKPIRTNKGLKALNEAIAILQEQPPLAPLSKSEATAAIADDKLNNFATASNIEYISYGRTTPEGIVMGLVVDDLFPDRRRRKSLLSPDANNTGVVCKPDPTYAKVCAIAYSDSVVDAPEAETASESKPENTPAAETETTASQPEASEAQEEPENTPKPVAETETSTQDTETATETLPAPASPQVPPVAEPEIEQPASEDEEIEVAQADGEESAVDNQEVQPDTEIDVQDNREEEESADNLEDESENIKDSEEIDSEEESADENIEEEDTEVIESESEEPTEVATNSDSSRILENVERGSLEEGDRVITEDGSFYDSYPLQGKSDESFIIYLESDEFDAFVALVDAQGNIVDQNDDISEENSNSRIRVTLPEDGTYNVIVNAYDEGGTGEYILTIRR